MAGRIVIGVVWTLMGGLGMWLVFMIYMALGV